MVSGKRFIATDPRDGYAAKPNPHFLTHV
jgi:hypothetical protein